MMRFGFFDEAVRFLEKTEFGNADLESLGLLPFRAGEYAVARGAKAALDWAAQFKDIQARSSALAGIAIYLARGSSREKIELSITGSKQSGAKIQTHITSSYRPFFDVTPFLPRE
jgi:hypothetical protein